MISKKMSPRKLATLMGLVVIVLCFITYNSLKGANCLNKNDKTIAANPVGTNMSLRDSVVDFGMELLGTPYVVAATGKDGFDCSGFVYYVFQHHNIQVPRSSPQYGHFGKEIPIENVRKGDVLVFLSPTKNVIGHVGIVTNAKGKESDFIHASSGRDMKVIITSLKNEGYARRFVKAVDVLSDF